MRTAGALGALLLVLACGGPPQTIAQGEALVHDEGSFAVVVPDGWRARQNRSGVTLTRDTPYGGGFPSLVVRRVDAVEAEALRFDGSRFAGPPGPVLYRYQGWSNTRGRGWRLEALVGEQQSWLFVEGSIWDDSASIDRTLFEAEFWPVVNSLNDRRR